MYRSTLVEWYKQLVMPIDHKSLGAANKQMNQKPNILGSKNNWGMQ